MKKLLLNSISVATTLLVLFSCKEESLNLSPEDGFAIKLYQRRGFAIPSKKEELTVRDCKSLYSKRPDCKSARTGILH